jgi:hypothetical protein
MRNCELINRRLEWRLDLYSTAIPEGISAARAANNDQPIIGEFPDHAVGITARTPFTDDIVGRTAASAQSPQ